MLRPRLAPASGRADCGAEVKRSQPLSRVERSGWSLSYTYVPGSDRLAEIQDHYGRRLILTYNGQNLLSEITTPAGHKVTYAYDGDGQLITVTYPDTHRRRYTYTSVTVDGHPEPALLTSITDENATLYASWNYDSRARPATSEHAGGVERHTFAYQPTTAGAITGATVTNPLAAVTQYTFQNILGANRLDSVSQPLAPGATRRYTYDANGNPASVTDYHGTLTSYTYDPVRNLELRRVEAEGRPEARTISTEWHASYRLPLRIAEPLKLTTFAYDAAGNPLTRSEQATPDVNGSQGFGAPPIGAARVWTLTYHGVGQVKTINGPRTDVADVTTTTYYPASDPDLGKRGQLASITNALGHLTTITAYDADGRPLTLVDANGNPHQFTWDVRGRLTRRALAGEQTTYTYDPAGQLTRIDAPDGSILRYTYDPAHRLTRIEDALGNRIDYTLDAAGNRLKEEVRDNGGALTRARTRQYDALSRLTQELGGQTPPQLLASYRYDAQGNRLEASTPLGTGSRSWGHSYDALSRLVRVTDPHGGITQTTYDGQHQVIAITDPRHLVTTYTRDGLGRTTRIASPDSGLTQQTFDAAGNLLTRTDAKDQPTTTTYDALDRPLRIDHADTAYDLYHWDQGDQGKGRLTRIEQYAPGGALTLAIDRQYDAHGRLLQESRQLAGVTYRSQYRYTHGRLSGLTTANGRRIDYTHDAQGRIDSITLTVGSDVRVLARDIRYHPFGGVKELTHGAGQTLRWTQDSDGRPSGYRLGDRHWQLGYDNAWRITSQMDTLDATQSVTTAYDALDRLTQASLGTVSHGYTYDATGNRLSQTTGASPRHYTIAASSNRLTAISGSPAKTYPHDANGSLSSDGAGQTHTYDARGRLRRVTVAGVSTDYLLDPFGQRIRKTGADDTLYHYDADGRLQSESAPDGTPRKDYVWLGDQPLAIIH